MADKKDKIADLPSMEEVSQALPLVRAVRGVANFLNKTGIGGEKARQVVESADNLLSQARLLELPDRFNATFAERGWIATSSLSTEVMQAALRHHADGNMEAAEEALIEWLSPDNINLFAISGSNTFGQPHGRWQQLREALALTEEGRYWSAIPLILIVCDGFASDVLGTSPFEKNADLTVFDSVVGHPTSLPAFLALMQTSVFKTRETEIQIPHRNGILHGRLLGYANRITCAKAWMLMIALVEWAIDKRTEEARRASDEERRTTTFRDTLDAARHLEEEKKAIRAFERRTWEGPFDGDLAEGEPPKAFFEFLSAWQAGNYGVMATWAMNTRGISHGKLAGDLRSSAELAKLKEFEILSISQRVPARAVARVRMTGESISGPVHGEFHVAALLRGEDGGIGRLTEGGVWKVDQTCVLALLQGRTVEDEE